VLGRKVIERCDQQAAGTERQHSEPTA
jgi:hypothetical protein